MEALYGALRLYGSHASPLAEADKPPVTVPVPRNVKYTVLDGEEPDTVIPEYVTVALVIFSKA
jgi:hypothetical protein